MTRQIHVGSDLDPATLGTADRTKQPRVVPVCAVQQTVYEVISRNGLPTWGHRHAHFCLASRLAGSLGAEVLEMSVRQ